MRSASRATVFLTTLIMLVSSAADLYAQEKVRLKVNIPPGTKWNFSQTEQMDMDMSISGGGQQQQLQQRASRKISGSAEVLESSNGIPTNMCFTFDRDCGGQMSMMGQTQQLPFSLAGQTVTVSLKGGQFSHDYKGPLEPQVEQELRNLADLDEKFLPDEPVGVGDSWTPDKDAIARSWQVDPAKNKFNFEMKLTDLKQMEGRQVAVVEMIADVLGEFPDMPGVTGERKIKGTALIDVESARVINSDAGGTIEGAGNTQMQGMEVAIQTRGSISSKNSTMLTSAPQGQTAAPAPAGGGANPLGDGAGPPSLAGTYKDDQITVELREQLGEYTGTITMGDQKFPLKARLQGNQLTGTFESQGNHFEFTAALEEGSLKLTTAGTEYRLSKVKKNPLSG